MTPIFTERFARELYDLKETIDFYFRATDAFEHDLSELDRTIGKETRVEKEQFEAGFRSLRQKLLKTKTQIRRQERMLENIIIEKNLESLRSYLLSSQSSLRVSMYTLGKEFLALKYNFQKFYMGLLSESQIDNV